MARWRCAEKASRRSSFSLALGGIESGCISVVCAISYHEVDAICHCRAWGPSKRTAHAGPGVMGRFMAETGTVAYPEPYRRNRRGGTHILGRVRTRPVLPVEELQLQEWRQGSCPMGDGRGMDVESVGESWPSWLPPQKPSAGFCARLVGKTTCVH